MKYDFDSINNRRNMGSYKWDCKETELAMWVGDMDFQTAPEVLESIVNRASQGLFGYNIIPNEWYYSYINWWKNYHNIEYKKEELMFSTGIVPAISSIVRKLTTPAENVCILTPTYNIFYNSILNNGRNVLECKLVYKDGIYEVDYNDLEEKLSNPQTSLFILCNPHNPIGKIWNIEEIEKIASLCKKYNVLVISDEIHCDLCDPNKEYTPFLSVNETTKDIGIALMSPTKTFNLAGLQTAAIAISNPYLRHKVWRGINTDEVAEPNCFAAIAPISAFNKGREWSLELREYLYENKNIAKKYLKDNIKELYLVPTEATFFLWIDCSKITSDSVMLSDYIRKSTGLILSNGKQFGDNRFLRMNVACPKEMLLDGLNRLNKAIKSFVLGSDKFEKN